MNKTKRIRLGLVLVLIAIVFAFLCIGISSFKFNGATAYANSKDEIYEKFMFTKTNDSECSVRLKDKTLSLAVIPDTAVIDGKEYTVTSIYANGFASATNLKKVRLPETLKIINQSAFANCKSLKSITLPGIERIGANAFASTGLEYLIIPETVNKVAQTILRNCDTQVYIRADLPESATFPTGWVSNWNAYNNNQEVEYSSKFIPDIEFREITGTLYSDDSSDFVVGYEVEEFQPFVEKNIIKDENGEDFALHIPATYNGSPVIGIANSAFYGNSIPKIIIGYSQEPITIGSSAFEFFEGNTVIINRDVILEDIGWDDNGDEVLVDSESLFAGSNVAYVALPDSITALGNYAFMNCSSLQDIQFISPKEIGYDEELKMLTNINSTRIVQLPENEQFTTLGADVFSGITLINELYIPQNVKNVGSNILTGWNNSEVGQTVFIDYENENSLPLYDEITNSGWNADWKSGCEEDVIEYMTTQTFSVTYNLNNAINKNPITVTRKDQVELKDAICDAGYKFLGWFDNDEYKGEPISRIEKGTKNDLMFYGKVEPISYKISYNSNKPDTANDVVGSMDDSSHFYNTSKRLSKNEFTIQGWHFVEWNTDSEGKGTSYTDLAHIVNLTIKDNDIIDLFAQWAKNEYYIDYSPNSPTGNNNDVQGYMAASKHIYSENSYLSENKFTVAGWHFIGWNTKNDKSGVWFDDCDLVNDLTDVHNSEIKLYAQWDQNVYDIRYEPNKPTNASSVVIGSMEKTTHTYGNQSNLRANGYSLVGWHFTGWKDESGNWYADQADFTYVSYDHNSEVYLYAQWLPNQYKVVYEPNKPANASSTVTGSMEDSSHTYDVQSNLRANGYSLAGWHFMSWEDENGNWYANMADFTTANYAHEDTVHLYAQWEQNSYTVVYEPNKPTNASSVITGSMTKTTHTYDTQSNLRELGYSLKGWHFTVWKDENGNSYLNQTDFTTVNYAHNFTVHLKAQWLPNNYSVEYESNKPTNASSVITGSMTKTTHTYDTQSNLRGFGYSLRGWHFTGWKDVNGTWYADKADFTYVNYPNGSVIHLYAQWDPNTYTIVYRDNRPYSSLSVSGNISSETHTVDESKRITSNTFSMVSYSFKNWSTASSGGGTSYSPGALVKNLSMNNGATVYLYAQWTEKSLTNCLNNDYYEICTYNQLNSIRQYPDYNIKLMLDIEVSSSIDWVGIPVYNGTFDGNSHQVTYKNTSVLNSKNYGFIVENNGTIKNLKIKGSIKIIADGNSAGYTAGLIVGINYGTISHCSTVSYYGSAIFTASNKTVDIYNQAGFMTVGGIAGTNSGNILNCDSGTYIGGDGIIGGIAGRNSGQGYIDSCTTYSHIYFESIRMSQAILGGIVGILADTSTVTNCKTVNGILIKLKTNEISGLKVYAGLIVGYYWSTASMSNCTTMGYIQNHTTIPVNSASNEIGYVFNPASSEGGGNCIVEGTLITLSDGSQIPVEQLKGDELLLVWNMYTGSYDVAPILFIDSDPLTIYEVINLYFSDGTVVKVISEHAFWDFDLNKYVFLRNDAYKYIGHWFNKQVDERLSWEKVQLIDVQITEELTTAWSPVTYGHLCYYVNGMLSMPGATEGFINIFEVDSETLKIDESLMLSDIEKYGLFTYEEFAEIYPINEEIFEAFNGQYLKISVGKGLITMEEIGELINHYAEFLS